VREAQAEAAARLIERLLSDDGFRTRFRRDPAAACHEAGLASLADEMAMGAGKAMVTLEIRESRSSLAGVLMAAAMEGVGVYEFGRQVLPHLDDVPPAVGDVLSRVNLPAIRGALAPDPPSAAAVAPVVAPEEAAVAPPALQAPPAPPEEEGVGEEALDEAEAAAEDEAAEDEAAEAEAVEAPGDEEAAQADAKPARAAAVAAGAGEEPAAGGRVDPGQFGAAGVGSGGPPDAQALALLDNERVVLDEVGVADVKAGRIDPRVIAVLTKLSEEHKITVSCMCSDHSKFTAGGSISNHYYGRGLDIAAIDGVPVSSANFDAREIAFDLQELDAAYRPNEIGTPWQISGPGYFTDAAHQDHLHIGFKQAIDPDWKAPADVRAPAAGSPAAGSPATPAPGAPASTAPPPAGSPTPAAPAASGRRATLAFQAATAAPTTHNSQPFLPAATPPATANTSPADTPPANTPPAADTASATARVADSSGVADAYPGDDAPREQLAAWLAKQAEQRGLPPELPVMAALVESNLRNLDHGHADSVGFFQMRLGIWNQGKYAGYPDKPELQAKWFLDEAQTVMKRRLAAGEPLGPAAYGEWIADVERPAEQYRGRYQLRLEEARGLLRGAGSEPATPAVPAAAAVETGGSAGGRVDPGQFGAAGVGSGGPPDAQALALLDNERVVLDEVGVADVKAGRIDPRVIAVLTKLSEEHKITVSCMCSDHSKFTAGGSISNHYYGRGLDIAAIDGVPVSSANFDAREIAFDLQELDAAYRPNEIGTPWQISGPGYFTDAAHQDHLHIGFKQAIDPDWKAPADVRAPAAGSPAAGSPATPAPGAPASTAPPPAGSPTPAAPAASGRRATLAFQAATAAPTTHNSQPFLPAATPDPPSPAADATPPAADAPAPDATPPAADAPAPVAIPAEAPAPATAPAPSPQADAGAGQAAAEQAAPAGNSGAPTAGPRALAALKEAQRHMGTPYKWGGSTPATGFDCSGLVQWAYAKAGIQIPRVTDQQILASNGEQVSRDDLVPGDLVFFRDETGYVYHVGMSLGGDRFLHAPRTGDVVKVATLDEPYFASRFTGARRFDTASGPPAAPASSPAAPASASPRAAAGAAISPAEVARAQAAVARDAAEVNRRDSALFKAIKYQERRHNASVQFLKAIDPSQMRRARAASPADPPADLPARRPEPTPGGALEADRPAAGGGDLPVYPGDGASRQELAKWLAAGAARHGLPPELPVMAALVESGVRNLRFGHADSVGFFQMRVGIWNKGAYAGYPDRPELQLQWFIDQAVALKDKRIAAGYAGFGTDPARWGEWIADVERPAERYRGRYQQRLDEARALLR